MSSARQAEISCVKANMKYWEEILAAEVMLAQFHSDNGMPPPNNKALCENLIAALFQAELEMNKLENSMDSDYGVDALAASTQGMNLSD
jgi:hypothetical protein